MNVNLMKLSRVGVASIKGLKCVVIPIAENDIFISLNDDGKAKSAYGQCGKSVLYHGR